ncbi:MAG: hypothetical protein ACYDAD_11520 [Acidimicrobiales bacterium]
MATRPDCRHYSTRTIGVDVVERCRLDANQAVPFACPDGCIFFEPRAVSDAGWIRRTPGNRPDEGPRPRR